MMKSVALTESVVASAASSSRDDEPPQDDDDDGFVVLVPSPSYGESGAWELSFDGSCSHHRRRHHHDDDDECECGEDEDESYDRCDDAFSLYSAPQSLAIDSNALESFHKDFFRPAADPVASTASLGRQKNPIVELTAADDFLLREFSAHGLVGGGASGVAMTGKKVAGQDPDGEDDDEEEDLRDLIAAYSSSCEGNNFRLLSPPFGDDDDEYAAEESSVSAESSAGGTVGGGNEDAPGRCHPLLILVGAEPTPSTAKVETESPEEPVPTDHFGSALTEADALSPQASSAKPTSLGKKKRRKQLKLAKRAAAAAAAAAALTHIGSMVATSRDNNNATNNNRTNPATSTSNKHPSITKLASKRQASRNRKQIANVAVACAAASYASYREECLRKNKK